MRDNKRDQIIAIWDHETPDFFPIGLCGFWKETLIRWHDEGLEVNMDPNIAAGIKDSYIDFIPVDMGMIPRYEIEILHTDKQYITVKDEYGVTKRMLIKDYYATGGKMALAGEAGSMSQWLEFPITNMSEWEEVYSKHFIADSMQCLPHDWENRNIALVKSARKRIIAVSSFPFLGTLGAVRQLMGLEGMIYAMHDDPELVCRIVDDLCEHWLNILQPIIKKVPVDMVIMFEDMCYDRSSLISPSSFERFFGGIYKKLKKFLVLNGINQLHVDTDGNAKGIIPEFMNAGVTGLTPLEVQAGMDAQLLTEEFPQLLFTGGIDKRSLTYGKEEIEYEIKRRFNTAWKNGGYIPALDHGIPPNVSFDNFRWYVEIYRKYSKDMIG